MLPGKNGFEVASELRAARNFVPVLMLTAMGRPEDVLKGFAAGADDYLPKPFELAILLARLQGLLRRSAWHQRAGRRRRLVAGQVCRAAGEIFPFEARPLISARSSCKPRRNKIQLTLMEADLLRHLIRSNGRVVSRKSILEEVWGLKEEPTRGRSTTLLCGYGVTSRKIRRSRAICLPCAGWVQVPGGT